MLRKINCEVCQANRVLSIEKLWLYLIERAQLNIKTQLNLVLWDKAKTKHAIIENTHVSRVFATRACNFPAIQFDAQLLAPNMSDASPRCLHQNFTSTWSLFKVQRIKIIQLNCCSTNWRSQTSKKSPNVFKIAVDWWPILQGRHDMTIFKEDFTWTSTSSACSLVFDSRD